MEIQFNEYQFNSLKRQSRPQLYRSVGDLVNVKESHIRHLVDKPLNRLHLDMAKASIYADRPISNTINIPKNYLKPGIKEVYLVFNKYGLFIYYS